MKSSSVKILLLLLVPAAGSVNAQTLSRVEIDNIGGANALSPPAARHLVRIVQAAPKPNTYLLALQRDGAASAIGAQPGLGFFRSNDDGQSWQFYAPINASTSERDTADLILVNNDVAVVYSFDGPGIVPNSVLDPQHKVVFQWWRYNGATANGDWTAGPVVPVFTPAAGEAYHRAEIARDSQQRIWVQAWKRTGLQCQTGCTACLPRPGETDDGNYFSNTLVVAVSTDGGLSFQEQTPVPMITTSCRAGGRILSLGTQLLMLWNDYSANSGGTTATTKFIVRNDSTASLTSWSTPAVAFNTTDPNDPADGIYHGAALSAVADGGGGFHLVYKDHNNLGLWYRRFTGGAFGTRTQIDPGVGDFSPQPAISLVGTELNVFVNHPVATNNYQLRLLKNTDNFVSFSAIESTADFKGYPTTPETLPAGAPSLPCVYGATTGANNAGKEVAVRAAVPPAPSVASSDSMQIIIVTDPVTGAQIPVVLAF